MKKNKKPFKSVIANFKSGNMGIRASMILAFAIFTLVTIIILLVMQIVLLRPMYEIIKTSEARSSVNRIEAALAQEDYINSKDLIVNIIEETNSTVILIDELGSTVGGYRNGRIDNMILEYSVKDLHSLYQYLSSSSSEYTDQYDFISGGIRRKGLIYAKLISTKDFGTLGILYETNIMPVDSTIDTLKLQLVFISLLMLLTGLILAFFISNKISKPIVSINKSAKDLANGMHNSTFDETGIREVRELAQTLNYTESELLKVETLRRELLANVSHDLRTPLTMIKGYSEVMRDIPNENNAENAQIIIDESSRLADLVNDLLNLSRLESGRENLNLQKFNLTMSIKEIMERYNRLSDFTFSFIYDENVYVYADELKISQVVYNLINNAVNYSEDQKEIIVRQTVNNELVKIEVIDHGLGIEPDKLKDIWERYYKIDKEHKRAHVGTGLGLSIVKNILEMHKGKYGVQSELNKGSTFWFELKMEK